MNKKRTVNPYEPKCEFRVDYVYKKDATYKMVILYDFWLQDTAKQEQGELFMDIVDTDR